MHEVAELTQDHLLADFLAHADEGETKYSICLHKLVARAVSRLLVVLLVLVIIILLVLDVLVANVQKLLQLEHGTSASPSANLSEHGCRLRHRVFNDLKRLKHNVNLLLLSKVKQGKAKGHESGPLVLELVGAVLVQEGLNNGFGDV